MTSLSLFRPVTPGAHDRHLGSVDVCSALSVGMNAAMLWRCTYQDTLLLSSIRQARNSPSQRQQRMKPADDILDARTFDGYNLCIDGRIHVYHTALY